jgi:hypothetical protein
VDPAANRITLNISQTGHPRGLHAALSLLQDVPWISPD